MKPEALTRAILQTLLRGYGNSSKWYSPNGGFSQLIFENGAYCPGNKKAGVAGGNYFRTGF